MPGDGIGHEVMAEAEACLRQVAAAARLNVELTPLPWPSTAWHRLHGAMMPGDWRLQLTRFDALLLGALGDPGPLEDPNRYRLSDAVSLAPLLAIRKGFDQWACERPARLLPGAPRYLRDPRADDIDMLVIRENSEGEYVDQGGRQAAGTPYEIATQISLHSRRGVERILRYAFERARSRAVERRAGTRAARTFNGLHGPCDAQVCLVTKRNAIRFAGELYCEVFETVAANYPDIDVHHELVDAACMKFVTEPWRFDVVVASNLFGDVLTDLAAVLCGGMGVAPSCNLNPSDRYQPPMFEPTHGSAPDIAGRGIAGPAAMLLTTVMMLRWMGVEDAAADSAARLLEQAVIEDLAEHGVAGRKTHEVGEDIRERLRSLPLSSEATDLRSVP